MFGLGFALVSYGVIVGVAAVEHHKSGLWVIAVGLILFGSALIEIFKPKDKK